MRIRWRGLELPNKVICDYSTLTDTYGKFSAEPFERGVDQLMHERAPSADAHDAAPEIGETLDAGVPGKNRVDRQTVGGPDHAQRGTGGNRGQGRAETDLHGGVGFARQE